MKKLHILLILCSALPSLFWAQQPIPVQRPPRPASFQPKLVVGIVVDQMRYDYLYRYTQKYGGGGFKRLLREGFSCENTQFNYVPTYTGPGHASIYTGTTPSLNGIIANDWFDRSWGRNRYVTEDTTVTSVHAPNNKAGMQSPRSLVASTITDELRLSNNFQSKVVGVCLKDRGSILPAGHIPNACYWFDDESGNWITSSYYPNYPGMDWVDKFNQKKLPEKYLAGMWTPQLPENQYTESFKDWEKYEKRLGSGSDGKFPHDLQKFKKSFKGVGLIRYTPMGNTLTVDFALEAIQNWQLGDDDVPDFLALSFSSTDYCGHHFGIHAQETQDVYLNLDRELERLLHFLDQKVGKENYLVFLTADHGGGETPAHLNDLGIPAGVLEESKLPAELNQLLGQHFGTNGNFIHDIINQQIYLNHDALAAAKIDLATSEQLIINYLRKKEGIYDAHTRAQLLALPADYPTISDIRRGVFPRRSGDIFFLLDPAWHPDDRWFKTAGATHGSPFTYDTHVPLLWFGWKVRPGVSYQSYSISDIAPTLSAMLKIAKPNAATGKIIEELLR